MTDPTTPPEPRAETGPQTWRCPSCEDTVSVMGMCQRCGVFGVRREDAPAYKPHPDANHEFRTVCRLCGEDGYLHVAVITDLEVVKVEPR